MICFVCILKAWIFELIMSLCGIPSLACPAEAGANFLPCLPACRPAGGLRWLYCLRLCFAVIVGAPRR